MNFDQMTLLDLEQIIDSSKSTYEESHKRMIHALASIERRQLHKQDEKYKRTSFSEYIKARFDISYVTYAQSKALYIQAPELAQTIGTGLARKAISHLGLKRTRKAIAKAASISHKAPADVPHNTMRNVIHGEIKRAEAERAKAKAEDMRPTTRELVDKDKIIMQLREELAEKEEQVEKLKKTLADRDSKISALLRQLEEWKTQYGYLHPQETGSHAAHA